MASDQSRGRQRRILISLAISGLLLALGWLAAEQLTARMLLHHLLWPLARLLTVIALGLALGEIIETSGWTRRLGTLARPFFRFAHLGDHCGAAFTTAFFSGTAANTLLADFHRDGKISTPQLFLTNLLNHFPAYFLHLPTTLFIVLPLTGRAGILYLALTFSALLLRCGGFLLYGRWRIPESISSSPPLAVSKKTVRPSFSALMTRIRDKLPGRLAAIATYVIPIYILIFVLNKLGLFSLLRERMTALAVETFIPLESLSLVILSFTAEFTSGFAAAGALLEAGILTVKQTVLALLIGNIIAFPIRALRHQLPRYVGIFSPRRGLELLLMGQGFRILSLIVVGYLYYRM